MRFRCKADGFDDLIRLSADSETQISPPERPGAYRGEMGDVVRLHPAEATRDSAAEPLWREVVGRQLREERTMRGERILDVAGRAGVSPQYLSELERGRKDASSELLSAVAGALDTTVLDLMRGAAMQLARASVRSSGPVCLAA